MILWLAWRKQVWLISGECSWCRKSIHGIVHFGGEENAANLSKLMVARLDYFYIVWCEGGKERRDFTTDEILGLEDSVELVEWELALDVAGATYQKQLDIRNFVPLLR